jgi:hypothetical protein
MRETEFRELAKAIKSWTNMVTEGLCTAEEATNKILDLVIPHLNAN